MATYGFAAALFLALLRISFAADDLIPEVSFTAPFEDFDINGIRNVPGYRSGGHADVKKNFVRLTSSRQV
jgi:hypothetical protein